MDKEMKKIISPILIVAFIALSILGFPNNAFAATAEVLVVAGGAGAGFSAGGAGGAGGVVYHSGATITARAYTITIGGGGAGGDTSNEAGANGINSLFDDGGVAEIEAVGGGG